MSPNGGLDNQIKTNTNSEGEISNFDTIYATAYRLFQEKYQFLIDALTPILLDEQDCRSYMDLALDLIPEEFKYNPVVAKKIIHIAVRAAVELHNKAESDPCYQIDLQARASRVRTKTNLERQSGHVMLESMGRSPFTIEHIAYILHVIESPEFQWQVGPNTGRPNWCKVTIAFNNQFGTNRTAKSLSDQIKTMRHTGDPRLEHVIEQELVEQDEDGLGESIFYIERFLQKVIIEKELYERFATQLAFILNDLTDVRSYYDIVRDLMPEEYGYGYSASNQIISMLVDLIRFDSTIPFSEELFAQRKVIINLHRKRQGDQAAAMLERQGIVRFSVQEFTRFIQLKRTCVRHEGPQVGRTNYIEVAEILNEEFHNGNNVRTADKLSGLIRAYRQNHKQKSYIYPNIDDDTLPLEALVHAYHLVGDQEA